VIIVPFPSFADSSRRDTVQRHVNLVESAAPSGNSQLLHSSMNFGSKN